MMANDEPTISGTGPEPAAMLDAIAGQEELEQAPAPEAERESYLGFFLGADVYGLPLRDLREVCRLTGLRRVPGAPTGVAGLVNLRGEIVCALDARAILGVTAPPPAGPAFFVALRGFPDPLGLVVDSIADVYAIDPAEIEPPPSTWTPERAAFFVGTAQVREGPIGLLDLQRVVRS